MSLSLQQLFAAVRRAPFLVFCLAAFVLLGVADYFLWQHQRDLTVVHEDVRREGDKMFSALSGHGRIAAELTAADEALKRIDRNLINETDLAENLGYFYQLETLSRVRLTQLNQLSSQPPAEDGPYRSVPFSVRATGTYPQLINFIRELESGPRLLRIKTYDFSRADVRNDTLALGLTVEVLAKP